ncbi:phage virion morphogenesis protein [Parabacteroides sp. W1-Q-101]|uniref:phage virion morphogenesis protein n=1 Tax=Parabacteroides caeci TaxID=2949650 RepID=UPI00202F0538|nr:phage virion morphogenesis protein [Parabacteroides sp. W1-Q-101]MCM0719336.1 phage virion morphogenesis protein [Parabacteroides sp. W1-Q-101]
MNFNELENYFSTLPDKVLADAAEIVAETATTYYKESFRKKAFDGNPWKEAAVPRRNGSLLIDSGNLMGSIRPAYVGPDKVVISAGNEKVDYAKVQNEGFTGQVTVPAHVRHTSKYGNVEVREHTRMANIPARPFMGPSDELADEIHRRLEGYIDKLK